MPESLMQASGGVDGNNAVSQRLPIFSQQVWAVSLPGKLCLAAKASQNGPASAVCSPTDRVLREGVYFAAVPPASAGASKKRTIIGLAPDGVVKVRVLAEGVRPKVTRVVENVFAVQDESRAFPESIQLIR